MYCEAGRWWLQLMLLALLAMTACIHSHEAVNPLQQQPPQHEHHMQQHQQPPQQQQHHPPSSEDIQHQNNPGSGHHQPTRTIDRNSVHDEEHLKEHLDGHVKQEGKLSDEEMQFRYFKVHDYDGNNKLDGIELIKALTHHHSTDGKEKRIPDEELSEMINEILNDNDRNRDGYIDYPEFILSQRTENS